MVKAQSAILEADVPGSFSEVMLISFELSDDGTRLDSEIFVRIRFVDNF